MKIIFPVMGAENVAVSYLSTILKKHGHNVKIAFDRSLFDDKQYFSIDFLAKLFSDKKKMVSAIIDANPDILAFSVFADNYQWSLDVAQLVRAELDCITIWGGMHATSCPDIMIGREEIDYLIVGEGEEPMVELLNAIENNLPKENIQNLWYRDKGELVSNKPRKLMSAESFPKVDKSIYEDFIPIKEYYLTVTSKGCIATCSYCMQNFLKHWEDSYHLGKFLREKPVDDVLDEFKEMKKKYDIKYIDIKNNVLTGNRRWLYEFLEKYPKEVGLPFRIMGHPMLCQGDAPKRLKEAGCSHIQIGIESFNPDVRENILFRNETNEQIIKALDNIEEAGIDFSADLIVGLPKEKEEDLILALNVLSKYKKLIRASIFWLQYLPKVDITKKAIENGLIDKTVEVKIDQGLQDNYLSTGSPMESDRKRILKTYHILFRMLPLMSERTVSMLINSKLYNFFRYLPFQTAFIIGIDVFVSIVRNDYYAKWIMKWYFKHIFKKFIGKSNYVSSNWD